MSAVLQRLDRGGGPDSSKGEETISDWKLRDCYVDPEGRTWARINVADDGLAKLENAVVECLRRSANGKKVIFQKPNS